MIYFWLIACAVMDARERRVPNALTFPLMGLALVQLGVYQTTLSGAPAMQAAIGAGSALVLTLPGFILGRLGAGDVKLLVALGLASTPGLVVGSFVYGTGALLLWATFQWLRSALPTLSSRHEVAQPSPAHPALRERAFAPSLLIGALVTAWWPLLP